MASLRVRAWVVVGVLAACATAEGQNGGAAIKVSKETTGITEPLLANGMPDYVGAINARYGKGVTAENNGFLLWLQVMPGEMAKGAGPKAQARFEELLGVKGPQGKGLTFQDYERVKQDGNAYEQLGAAAGKVWTEKEYPELAAYLRDMKPALEVIEQAAAKEHWWCPAVMPDEGGSPTLSSPGFPMVQSAVRALDARATLRFGAGDFDGFLKDFVTARRLAAHMASGPGVSERLRGRGAAMMAERSAGAVLASGKLTLAQCQAIAKAMDDAPALGSLAEAEDVAERWSAVAAVYRISGMPEGQAMTRVSFSSLGGDFMTDDLRKKLGTIDRSAVDWNLVLTRMNAYVDRQVVAMRLPRYSELKDANNRMRQEVLRHQAELTGAADLLKRDGESERDYSERIARAMVSQIGTVSNLEAVSIRLYDMYEPMLRALLAAAMFKAKTEDWPDRLEQVVPEFLPAIGKDIYSPGSDAPLSYIVSTSGPRVYSIGLDGKDDFGQQVRDKKTDDPHMGADEVDLP